MSKITLGNLITLAAIADRWNVTEDEAEAVIRLVPTMSNLEEVEYGLQDGTPLWEAFEVEDTENSFPELEAGEHEKVVALMTSLIDVITAFDALHLDALGDVVRVRGEKNRDSSKDVAA